MKGDKIKQIPNKYQLITRGSEEDMNILGGHQRVAALKKLKETKVPVKQVFGLTEEQKKEFIVKDNQIKVKTVIIFL